MKTLRVTHTTTRVLVAAFSAAAVAFQPLELNSASLPKATELPAQTTLPDPLVMLDGRKVTTREMWFNERRPELIRLFQHYIDQNGLVALCAPRPVLFTNGRADTWINPAGQFDVMRGAAAVYRLLGAGDFAAEELPPDGQWMDGTLGYYLRAGGHSLLREDWEAFLDFADKHFAMSGPRSSRAGADPIIIDPEYPHAFRYRSGGRFFPMGDTAYFLIAQPTNIIAQFMDSRRACRFNFIRMMAMAEGFWPFGGTAAKPDYTVIQETALRKWDWVFECAASRDMHIELILWGYGVAGGEGLWADPINQNRWIDTLVKRCRARPNLFLYTVANEFERYPVPSTWLTSLVGGPIISNWPRALIEWSGCIPRRADILRCRAWMCPTAAGSLFRRSVRTTTGFCTYARGTDCKTDPIIPALAGGTWRSPRRPAK